MTDSNHGPLELEATALQIEPQPLPLFSYFLMGQPRPIFVLVFFLFDNNFTEKL